LTEFTGTVRIGYALCGSFCTLRESMNTLRKLRETHSDITPIMSEITYATDTRFGKAADFIAEAEDICGKPVIHTIDGAEPIGPRALLDLIIISPATGNTISKIAAGITDSSVTMAVKAHLRNGRPVLIALSSNDALSGSASSLGKLLVKKNMFFVPFGQDDPFNKPTSIKADFTKLEAAAAEAVQGRQLQPLLTVF